MSLKKKSVKNTVVGLDIGTSKIICIIGELDDGGNLNIIGFGKHPSTGLKRGVVVNIDATVASIQRAVEQAEEMAGLQVRDVYVGIAGSHIRSFNSNGIVAISAGEVIHADVDRVVDAARAVAIPADQKILHILPQEFIIDQQDGIREPIGMAGVRLEVKVHIVTGAVSSAQNIDRCVRQCGLSPADIILEQLASSYSVLSDDEKELGVCLIDIGAGTTDIAVFTQGAIRHTAVIPLGGDQVTSDLAIAFRMPPRAAESFKVKHAGCMVKLASDSENIQLSGAADRSAKFVSEKSVAQIVQARYEELFRLVLSELRRSGFDAVIPSGIVVTGGASRVNHLIDLAETVFEMPVRVGTPENLLGIDGVVDNPSCSTAVGLLHYGLKQAHDGDERTNKKSGGSFFTQVKNWFKGNM
ncbi:MAG: cell division protein FtsA [Gammaproteobacteria bacterium]|nr:cell division protein FtsA [Gammaproteobacteria bacterium]MCD8542411.1 cell division protein FtsA [Gammaproteobacteria bacterium]